jgi:hypothetical protein
MRYSGAPLISLMAFMLFMQPAYSDKASGVMVLLYPPTSCAVDFDSGFWAKYDSAMAQEWNIHSQTLCMEGLTDQIKADFRTALLKTGFNVIDMSVDNIIVRGLSDRAHGVAQPTENFGAVNFNYQESTKVVSHETLHLMLEEAGYPQSCYVDAVHEHAYSFARYDDNVMILAHFDC